MSEIKDILEKKREVLAKMILLEKKSAAVQEFLKARKTSEELIDYLTLELEYSKLSHRENILMGIVPEQPKAECEHPVKLITKQTEKNFECVCLECGKKVIMKQITNPLRNGTLYAQEPENIDLYSLRREVGLNPSLINIQSKINQGEFNKPSIKKR